MASRVDFCWFPAQAWQLAALAPDSSVSCVYIHKFAGPLTWVYLFHNLQSANDRFFEGSVHAGAAGGRVLENSVCSITQLMGVQPVLFAILCVSRFALGVPRRAAVLESGACSVFVYPHV
jgi:hypothetical protein